MDRKDFIIIVYLLVCEHYQAIKTRIPVRRGVPCTLLHPLGYHARLSPCEQKLRSASD